MQPSIIIDLQNEFLSEAKSAPKLFKDLGKVEHYIAESYKTRSFIELIQNADDAGSSTFGIYSIADMLVVANDGRPFTVHDIEALCRSGSSNKSRGGSTIGYRGIGFKSVVNLAKRIYIFSGDFKFYFDKATTSHLLPDIPEVPLIRVLHPFDESKDTLNLIHKLEKLADHDKYTTYFIFCDIDDRILQQELQDFDRSSLLFLNNINRIISHANGVGRDISVTEQGKNNQRFVEIKEGDKTDTWNISASSEDPRDVIAFKIVGDTIIPASQVESVVHSFTPTIEFAGAHIKINGDFSTDPSRKSIDFDDISQRSFENILTLLVEMIADVLEGKSIRKGFFSPFVNIPNIEGNKFKIRLYKGITEKLNIRQFFIYGRQISFANLRLRPDWLNYEDYVRICEVNFCELSKELLTTYPELPVFLELVGVKRLNLNEVMTTVNAAGLTGTGAAQIVTKFITQNSYELTTEKIHEIGKLKLFPKGEKLVPVKDLTTADDLNDDFIKYLKDHVDDADLKQFFNKFEIKLGEVFKAFEIQNQMTKVSRKAELTQEEIAPDSNSIFKNTPNLQKWRSAEKNALEYLKALKGILTASDVSTANMGYDLEATLDNGKQIFIEVKSVSSFSESFKITNNEYSSAHNYGDAYFIAVVINNDPFQMNLISNPIKNLSFQKQIERWSWFCDSYSDKLHPIEIITKRIM